MGGAAAFRTAAALPSEFAALASFHGGNLATEADTSPHLLAGRVEAEVYVGHADEDPSAPPEQQQRLAEAFTGKPFQAEVFAGAKHGFTMADTAVYDEKAAELHFRRLTELFRRALAV
jgi:carboxymethylenebutenolidase